MIIITGGRTYWDRINDLFGGERGREALIKFIKQGGGYIGTCFGSYMAMGSYPAYMQGTFNLTPFSNRFDREWHKTGVGHVYLRLSDHPLSAGVPKRLEVIHWNGVVWDTESTEVVATYEEQGIENELWNSTPLTEEKFNKHMKGFPAIIATAFGKGRVILSGPHPEFGHQFKRHASILKDIDKEDPMDVITRVDTSFLESPPWRYMLNMILYAAQHEKDPFELPEMGGVEFALRCSRLLSLVDRINMEYKAFTGNPSVEYERNLINEYSQKIPRIVYSLSRKKEIFAKAAFIVEKSVAFLHYAYELHPEGREVLPKEGPIGAAKKCNAAKNLAHIAIALETVLYPLEALHQNLLEINR